MVILTTRKPIDLTVCPRMLSTGQGVMLGRMAVGAAPVYRGHRGGVTPEQALQEVATLRTVGIVALGGLCR